MWRGEVEHDEGSQRDDQRAYRVHGDSVRHPGAQSHCPNVLIRIGRMT
jgi:hypothetical protein